MFMDYEVNFVLGHTNKATWAVTQSETYREEWTGGGLDLHPLCPNTICDFLQMPDTTNTTHAHAWELNSRQRGTRPTSSAAVDVDDGGRVEEGGRRRLVQTSVPHISVQTSGLKLLHRRSHWCLNKLNFSVCLHTFSTKTHRWTTLIHFKHLENIWTSSAAVAAEDLRKGRKCFAQRQPNNNLPRKRRLQFPASVPWVRYVRMPTCLCLL